LNLLQQPSFIKFTAEFKCVRKSKDQSQNTENGQKIAEEQCADGVCGCVFPYQKLILDTFVNHYANGLSTQATYAAPQLPRL